MAYGLGVARGGALADDSEVEPGSAATDAEDRSFDFEGCCEFV